MVPWKAPIAATIANAPDGVSISIDGSRRRTVGMSSRARLALLEEAKRIVGVRDRPRRKRLYEQFERDSNVREAALEAWTHKCQVKGCLFVEHLPGALRKHTLDVHHINHVGRGGEDSAMNVCLICAGHHALFHRAKNVRVVGALGDTVRVSVDGSKLSIERDVQALAAWLGA